MYGGSVDYSGFYKAGGWGPVVIANFPPAIWFVAASLSLLRRREPGVTAPALSQSEVRSNPGLIA